MIEHQAIFTRRYSRDTITTQQSQHETRRRRHRITTTTTITTTNQRTLTIIGCMYAYQSVEATFTSTS